ncbi:glycosyltransferase family 4 protein [Sphingobacterium olei]|uniref:Glycosyltransferase family 4 protein n=1 Tax=Sphingobacterium olei TaxID=2571155 RepID=A0A4U0P126_9SPHI|nr:glycosyltransferase [Sphingobacterium olei]TJZ60750.1 glycosyltransferase family 4 protein [Sphingobacterium olei]
MDKICFIVGLYGSEVNGGAEKHCKMLAENVSKTFHVEVLTSTTNNYITFAPYYSEGTEIINNVTVRRFKTDAYNSIKFSYLYNRSRIGRKIRRFIYKIGLLKACASLFPKWDISLKAETNMLKAHGLYSPDLIDYVFRNQNEYRAIFMISYPCPNFYFINKLVPDKTILIPTAHKEGDFFRSYLTHIFTTVKHIAFNSVAERELCYQIFGKQMATNSILAVGTELSEPKSKSYIQAKFDLPERYILYFGRIAEEKIGNLIRWFTEYKRDISDDVKLVLTGGLFMEKSDHPDIFYTGFVSEPEKTALIQHAELVINPSDRESLSLLLLEAMQLGKPSLVNGKSEVLKQHCIDSDFASQYYLSKSDFLEKLESALNSSPTEKYNTSNKAIKYVKENYSWDTIRERFKILTES